MPKEQKVSVDEFMSHRTLNQKGHVMKAVKAPPSWNAEKRSATFVMTAEIEDRDQDIIKTAGVDTTEFMKNPVALLFHKSRDWPIGTWGNLQKQPKQMVGDLTFLAAGVHEDADKAAAMVESGVLRAVSIGFMPKTLKRRELENGHPIWGYEIDECELYECSLVTVPANPAALAKAASVDPTLAREILEEVLDNWSKTPDGLIVPRAEYERAYQTVKAADVREKAPVVVTAPVAVETDEQKAQRIAGMVKEIMARDAAGNGKVQKPDGSHEVDVEQPGGPTIKMPEMPAGVDEEHKSALTKLWELIFGQKKNEKSGEKTEDEKKALEIESVSDAEKDEIISSARAAREKSAAILKDAA